MLRRLLLKMTVTNPPLEEYYARYAPRTHGRPPPVPKHNFPRGREFYKRIGEPKRVVAPMVDQSELVRSPLYPLFIFLMVGLEDSVKKVRCRIMLHAHDSCTTLLSTTDW